MADERQYTDEMNGSLTTVRDEYARIQLTALEDVLKDMQIECETVYDEDDGYILLVPVHGPENMNIALSLLINADFTMTLYALYGSDILKDPIMRTLDLPEMPDYEDIAENFVNPLAWECFIKEHEVISRIVPINGENAEAFINYLPDYFFGDEPYYACGISLYEKRKFIPCGAAVFSYTRKGMAINNVMIEEACRGIGLGTYLADYVTKNYSEVEK